MIILGVDPGTATTGYGVLSVVKNTTQLLECGVITTPATAAPPRRLGMLSADLDELITTHSPDWLAVEQLFFTNNAKTAIAVGQARGVILLAADRHHLQLAEYTPLQVKQAVTGYGQATKKQVQAMVKTILQLRDVPKPDDAADAVALAICHAAAVRGSRLPRYTS